MIVTLQGTVDGKKDGRTGGRGVGGRGGRQPDRHKWEGVEQGRERWEMRKGGKMGWKNICVAEGTEDWRRWGGSKERCRRRGESLLPNFFNTSAVMSCDHSLYQVSFTVITFDLTMLKNEVEIMSCF